MTGMKSEKISIIDLEQRAWWGNIHGNYGTAPKVRYRGRSQAITPSEAVVLPDQREGEKCGTR